MREKNDFLQHRATTQLIQCSARKTKKCTPFIIESNGKLFVRLEITETFDSE